MEITPDHVAYFVLSRCMSSDGQRLAENLRKLDAYIVADTLQIVCWRGEVGALFKQIREGLSGIAVITLISARSGEVLAPELTSRSLMEEWAHAPKTVFAH